MAAKKPNDFLELQVAMAEFRFGVIAPVVQGLYPDDSETAYFKRVTEKPLTLPDGREVQFSYKTPQKWLSSYRKGGFDALMAHVRSDKGTSRVLSDEAICEIFNLKTQFPRISGRMIHEKLLKMHLIPATVSEDAVQRFIKSNDLKGAVNQEMRDRKAFEESAFGRLWQADTCYITKITVDGKKRQVYAVDIIDDYSRLIVGAELFLNDNAENFQKVLKNAISTYNCVPMKLYVDNGAPYSNMQLSLICGSAGINLIHTRVRDGASKGKVLSELFYYPNIFRRRPVRTALAGLPRIKNFG